MLLLCLLLSVALGAVRIEIENSPECNSFGNGRETFRIFATGGPSDIIRAIDANLVAGPNTVITRVPRPGGNQAPVGPPLGGSQECRSFLAFNQRTTEVDMTWVTPDFVWTDGAIAKGWFLADPTQVQQRAQPGSRVFIGQITLQRSVISACSAMPKIEGTLNIILNGTRQNVETFCAGTGCFPIPGVCDFVTGYFVPIETQPGLIVTTYQRSFALMRPGVAAIIVDVSAFGGGLPTLARNATLGLGPAVGSKRPLLEVTYHSTGTESFIRADTPSVRRVIVTRVSTTNPASSNSQCPQSEITDLVRDRQYSVSKLVSEFSRQRISLQVEFRDVTVDLTGLPNGNFAGSIDFCAELDWRVRQALQAQGVNVISFDHRINQFPSTSTPCGRYAAQLGTPAGVGAFTHYGDVTGCQNVNGVLNGLLRNFGLERSDSLESPNTPIQGGDYSCPLGRTPANAGWQRRGLNIAQQIRWGVLAGSEIANATFTPAIITIHSSYYPGPDTGVFRAISLSLGYYAAFRSANDPLVDRMANAPYPLFQGQPNPGTFVGKTTIHQIFADGTTRFVTALNNGESFNNGVLTITQRDSTRYRAALGIQGATLPFPLFPADTPATGTFYGDSDAAGTSTQTSNGGANVLQSNNALPTLSLGLFGTDQEPVHYVRLAIEVPRFSVIQDAKLQLQATSRQTVAARGELYLEVAVDNVGSSAALTPGANFFGRAWSNLRQTYVVSSDQYQHDVIELPIGELLQSIVDRDDYVFGSSVTFRIRNDPSRPLQTPPATREVYSGDLCGNNYGGGPTRCGPRVVVQYAARTTSQVCSAPSFNSPTAPQPLSNVINANDGLTLTIAESGNPAHAEMLFIWDGVRGVSSAELTVRAFVNGPETFEVQYARAGGSYVTVQSLTFRPTDQSLTTRSASIPLTAFTGGSLTIRIRDSQTGSNAASSLIVDQLRLCVNVFNINCVLSTPLKYSRCPPCITAPQQCAPRLIVSQPLGTGTACGPLQTCRLCTASACPIRTATLTVRALVSIDSQQQWRTTQTSDTNLVDVYNITNLAPAVIGIAGKALTVPGTQLPGGFWVSNNFNQVPGTTSCRVVDAQLTCPSGDPLIETGFQGAMECKNGQIPGPTTPATTTFTIECT